MERTLITLCSLIIMAVSCQKTDDIRPIIPVAPPDTDTIVPSDPVPALFSVSDTQQVRFSPGNLQYVEGHWCFAEHQTTSSAHST